MLDRLTAWAASRQARVGGVNPYLLGIGVGRRFGEVRLTGLAAEMTYYALLSLIPFVLALGASLGFAEALLGQEQARLIEGAVIQALAQVFTSEAMSDVIGPLVRGLLAEARTGAAVLSLLVTLLLASNVFRAVIRALDDAYRVPSRRSLVGQWVRAYAMVLASILVIVVTLSLVVVGPLLGGGREIADWLGLGDVFEVVWNLGRWPVVLMIVVAFLAWVYTFGPNAKEHWRAALPGAVFAAIGTIVIAAGLRYYLAVAGPSAPQLGDADELLSVATQTITALLAVILWIWLTSTVVLLGGVINAELHRLRGEPVVVEEPPEA